MKATVWHGDEASLFDLLNAIAHNCGCKYSHNGTLITVCGAHVMMATDQRALDGLLFARTMRARLVMEEHNVRLSASL